MAEENKADGQLTSLPPPDDAENRSVQLSLPDSVVKTVREFIDTERQKATSYREVELARIEAERETTLLHHDYRLQHLQAEKQQRRDYLYAALSALLMLGVLFVYTLHTGKQEVLTFFGFALAGFIVLAFVFLVGERIGDLKRQLKGNHTKSPEEK